LVESGYCAVCGKSLLVTEQFCASCGTSNTLYREPVSNTQDNHATPAGAAGYNPYKNPTTAVLIAAIGGLFGVSGMGHMYVGKVTKGILILVAGLILAVVGGLTAAFLVGIPLLIGYLALWIWQIFDARKLANQYNEYLKTNGKQPW
jgi:TM2 domain-containing membrane protein YozV